MRPDNDFALSQVYNIIAQCTYAHILVQTHLYVIYIYLLLFCFFFSFKNR